MRHTRSVVSAQNLGRRYGSHWVLRHIDLQLEVGHVLVVTGTNGSGKSTLLRLLAGLESPSQGQIRAPGDVGFAALDLALYPQLTAREHLEWAGTARGFDAKSDSLLGQVGLAAAADQVTGTFSSGMKMRLKLAIAIQHSPPVLLLDEPTAPLDDEGMMLIQNVVEQQKTRGVTVIATNAQTERSWATHELALRN